MTKPSGSIPPSYIAAAERRQRYLDFLHLNPGSIAAQIEIDSVSHADKNRATNTLGKMLENGEVRFEQDGRNKKFYAVVEKTMSAEEMQKLRLAACKRSQDAQAEQKAKLDKPRSVDGYYRHDPNKVKHVCEGGQGALRPRVYVGAAGGII